MEQDFVSYLENGNLEDAETLYGTIHAMFGSCADSTLRKPVLPDFLLRFSPGWIYTRIMGLAVEMLQKLRDYKGAVELLEQLLEQKAFCGGKRGYWWDRLALNLNQHLKLAEKSLDAISRGLADDHVRTGHRLALIGRARRICSSSSHTEFRDQIAKFPLPYQHEPKEVEINGSVIADGVSGRKTVFIMADESFAAEDGDFMLSSVEDLALKHYLQAEKWEHGLHAEGSSLTAVFCLLLWDVIFASGVPDVFRTKYQASPLDFDTDHFYESRKDLIEKRLATMSNANNDDLCDMIAGTWNTHYGQMCMGMNWNLFPGQLRDAQICGRLAKDYHHCRGGVPDLTLWSPTTHTCKFVEVKGPGDRLSPKQVLWLDFLTGLGVDAEVCKVKAVGSRGIR
ncbi:fanconi-associated nuclease 1-like isoform X2 [Corticium candelabrum]|uniref:fanconi-associated nuclease 1-like isoform X2 n=1 Tax=Corticium candelabrum TaxID=121492 RepID=UPI002E270ABB|nr:fanconi-associated nuclease 1-like isoform X2 [Corticium candelabrum]